MSKNKSTKSKRVCEVKDTQKISSFFKKLDVKIISNEKDNDFQLEKNKSKEKLYSEEKNINKKQVEPNNIRKESTNTNSKKLGLNPINIKHVKKLNSLLNDSDEDFIVKKLKRCKSQRKVNDDLQDKSEKSETKTKKSLNNDVNKFEKSAHEKNKSKKKNIDVLKEKKINKSNKEEEDRSEKEILSELLYSFDEKSKSNGNIANVIKTTTEHKIISENTNIPDKLNKNKSSIDNKKPILNGQNKNTLSYSKNINLNNESNLIINLDVVETLKPQENSIVPQITPEKTYLNYDEVLQDVTNNKTIDSLFENVPLVKSIRKQSPPHSTPIGNEKKRKTLDSDIIPPTPEDEPKLKSKLCLEKKFRFQNKINDIIIPDRTVNSPPKKIRKISSKPNIIINLSELNDKQFGKLHNVSFKKQIKDIVDINKLVPTDFKIKNDAKLSEIVSPSLLQTKIINTKYTIKSKQNISPVKQNGLVGTPRQSPRKQNMSPSKWSSLLNSPNSPENLPVCGHNIKDLSLVKSPQKSINSFLQHFQELPSSCEEKKNIEIDTSNFIMTKKSPVKDIIEDFNFDDSWDLNINDLTINDLNLDDWQYCKVLEVTSDVYRNLILKVESLKNQKKTSVILQGIWRNIQIKNADKVTIKGVKTTDTIPYVVNNDFGFVVLEPDYLISGTSIVGSLYCKRKGVLSDKFHGFEPKNQIMIVGTLVHTLLQETLTRKLSKITDIEKLLIEILNGKNIVHNAYAANIPIDELKQQTLPFVSRIYDFISTYVYSCNKRKDKNMWEGKIDNIQDIEENIWCYNLGIKGKIDVTVNTNYVS